MACQAEADASGQAARAMHATKALNQAHQDIHQLIDEMIGSKDVRGRLQAVKSLESLQKQFNALAMQVKQQTQLANQGSKATSSCLAYDSTANHKVAECLRLEWEAQMLNLYLSSKPYGRFHPRYTLTT